VAFPAVPLVDAPLISVSILSVLVGATLTLVAGRTKRVARSLALATSLVPLALATYMLLALLGDPGAGYIFQESYTWIPSLGVSLTMGLDGIGLPLFWLTAFLVPVSIVFQWEEDHRPNRFHALLLMTGAAVMGVFAALDLFLFYVVWEFTLIPMFFLIAGWGGRNRRYAAFKFFLYTFAASLVMLLGFLGLYFQTGAQSFAIQDLANAATALDPVVQQVLFGALLVGFAVKMPVVPVHTWLPDAHVQAPTAGSVLLAGILLKMGSYGIIRIAVPLLPQGAQFFVPFLYVVGVLSILYGAVICLAQDDYKRLVAYSSISHMGMVLLGIATLTSAGVVGALFMMVAHGLVSPFLFMMTGVLKHNLGTRDISKLGGLAARMPKTAALLVAGSMASLGLPGMAPFVAEFQIFLGVWQAFDYLLFIPILVMAVTAAYYLWAIQRTMFGPLDENEADLSGVYDVNRHEGLALGLTLAFIVLAGIVPKLLTVPFNPAVDALLAGMGVA
jgi:NADH-quinone oxidoreductase subunit M